MPSANKKKKKDKKAREPLLPISDKKWKSRLKEVSKHK
jgi:hypothetical protein